MDPELGRDSQLLDELQYSEGWDCFTKHLNNQVERALTSLASGSRDVFDYRKGFLEGLQTALNLPKQIIELAKRA